jgi:hypothetical protein
VEVELLAPRGLSRYDLALAIAKRIQGTVHRFFHADSEPSKIPHQPLFYHLTPAFEVRDTQGKWLVRCVDDVTLRAGLNQQAPAQAGWYRIVSDDARLIGLIKQHTSADATLADSLSAVGALFATQPVKNKGNVYRLATLANEPIALAAPMPGERERACELITAPLPYENYAETLALLLQEAKNLGFLLPKEGASHFHFDGDAFTSANVLATIMNRLHEQRLSLHQQLNTNPHCTRIGAWSEAIINTINADDFGALSWSQARQRLATQKISKYCDFNIRNLVYPQQDKHTFEVRILPSCLDIEQFQIWGSLLHKVMFRG